MSKSKISKVVISVILGAFLISGSSFAANTSAKRTPAAGKDCSFRAKEYADWTAATVGVPICAKRAQYAANPGWTPLNVQDNCAADFASQTTVGAIDNGVYTVTVAGTAFMVACKYLTGGDGAEGDNGCHCTSAAAN